jgi:bifunctional DNA-binding transcriptional regulator/antitoxin component of YhaV-PrlF toxin-antitoxin module
VSKRRNHTTALQEDGTLTIPELVRKQHGITPGTRIEISVSGDGFAGRVLQSGGKKEAV